MSLYSTFFFPHASDVQLSSNGNVMRMLKKDAFKGPKDYSLAEEVPPGPLHEITCSASRENASVEHHLNMSNKSTRSACNSEVQLSGCASPSLSGVTSDAESINPPLSSYPLSVGGIDQHQIREENAPVIHSIMSKSGKRNFVKNKLQKVRINRSDVPKDELISSASSFSVPFAINYRGNIDQIESNASDSAQGTVSTTLIVSSVSPENLMHEQDNVSQDASSEHTQVSTNGSLCSNSAPGLALCLKSFHEEDTSRHATEDEPPTKRVKVIRKDQQDSVVESCLGTSMQVFGDATSNCKAAQDAPT